jgi:two-component system response regulator GlrR
MASVLLVDDSDDTLDMYAVGLASAGYRPVTATDVSSALDQLELEHPDVVITDLLLARGGSGWELIEALKKDPLTQDIPVILLTGHTDPSIAATAQRTGCAAVLTKPCLPDELACVLQRLLAAVADGGDTHMHPQNIGGAGLR